MAEYPIGFFEGDYKFLSNFARTPIIWAHPATPSKSYLWPTVEHAYQAAKTMNENRVITIGIALSPGQAKRLGNDRKLTVVRPDWEEVKDDIMLDLLRIKFSDSILSIKLRATYPLSLIEGNTWHDNYWGVCVCPTCQSVSKPARNMLGRLLEQVRDEIRG
jgi:hypothetical protein